MTEVQPLKKKAFPAERKRKACPLSGEKKKYEGRRQTPPRKGGGGRRGIPSHVPAGLLPVASQKGGEAKTPRPCGRGERSKPFFLDEEARSSQGERGATTQGKGTVIESRNYYF